MRRPACHPEVMALHLTGAPGQPELFDLPWHLPVEQWPAEWLVGLPRGVSRHVVRFVRLSDAVYAVKEIGRHTAEREYRVLRAMERAGVPAVQAVGVLDGREAEDGTPLETALVTRHLQFSLPYRALFSQTLRPETAVRLLDALAVLLVRLHLAGFYWGDCSLSNTLFRRDAGAFAAYLVDAETTEQQPQLSDGQRSYDVDMARTNIIGELMDLQAGDLLEAAVDPLHIGDTIVCRYGELWSTLTEPEVFRRGERHRVESRIRRLNELGFDVAELEVETGLEGDRVLVQPKVVDAGYHARRLLRLTGLDVEENQARRLLNDLDSYRAASGQQDEPEELVAHQWVTEVFTKVVRAVPRQLCGKLESAEVFHEVLEHRWFLSERAGRDVGTSEAVRSYVDNVLPLKPDEHSVLAAVPPPARPDEQS
jgi:tRNA A-37 threonylcarbamoyl transferase component Bud32